MQDSYDKHPPVNRSLDRYWKSEVSAGSEEGLTVEYRWAERPVVVFCLVFQHVKMEIRLGENTFDEINISDCDEFEHCDTHAEVIESMVTQIYSGISMVTGRTLSSSSNLLIVPLLVMSAVNVGIILTFEVFIVCKAVRSTPSRRHVFLSQALLLGLLLGSSLGFVYAVEPSGTACVVIRLGTGVAYALIYSALLVKQVFLISLNTGVYLPAAYQALLFSFCLLVQIVIGVQWLVLVPLCQYQAHHHIFSLFYIVFLIIFVTCIALRFRTIEENFSESFYISIVMIFTIIIWIFWVVSASRVQNSQQNACIGKR